MWEKRQKWNDYANTNAHKVQQKKEGYLITAKAPTLNPWNQNHRGK